MKKVISLLLAVIMVCSVFYSLPVTAFAKEVDVAQSASSTPVISVESVKLNPYMGGYGEIVLKVTGATNVTYQWQAGFVDSHFDMVDLPENNNYKGVNTNQFRLKAVGALWELDFRCKITYSGGTVYSQKFNFTFLDPEYIETAEVTGLEKPEFGYTPDYEIDRVDSDKYQNGDVEWYGPNYNGEGWVKLDSTDVFAGADYKCRIYLEPFESYSFNEESVVTIDGTNHTVTKTLNEESEDVFYTEKVYFVRYNDIIPEGLLDFEERTPDVEDNGGDNYLGVCYLGTDSMNKIFSFEPKTLPMNMYQAGYYIAENTRIANIRNESLYYENDGAAVNFVDYAKEKGKYYVEQTICLMSPEDETLAEKKVSYVVDVFEPEVATSAGITFNAFGTWTEPFYTYVARTPEIKFNTMFWYDVTEGKTQINNGDKFTGGHTYRMEVYIKTVDGYVFAVDENGCPDIDAKINGMPAEIMPIASNESAVLAFEFTFEGDSTEPSTTPTEPETLGALGDANEDGKVNIKDATLIQKHIVGLITLTDEGCILADVDDSDVVNIKDATAIQKHIAGIETGYPIGKAKTK